MGPYQAASPIPFGNHIDFRVLNRIYSKSVFPAMVALSLSLLMYGCRSRFTSQINSPTAGSSCSSQALSPEALFNGAKPAVAVVRTGSVEGSAFAVYQNAASTILITNSHVVGNSNLVNLKWADGHQESGSVIASLGAEIPQKDLALIEVQGIRGKPLLLKKRAPNVGADIVAIGAPQGLEFSLTRGVVSGIRDNGQILQIDAPINPGNSGGPILDKSGCVVGIATFKLDDSEGLNFAVSAALIEEFLRSKFSSVSGTIEPPSKNSILPPSPFSSVINPPRPTPPTIGNRSANCWFQAEPGSQNLSGSICQISTSKASQGRTEVRLADGGGINRVIYLGPGDKASVYVSGRRFDGEWLRDQDGDIRVHIQPEVFAFQLPQ